MKNKLFYGWVLITLVFLGLPLTAWAVDSPVGVAYRGHIQDRGDYPLDGSWVDSPAIIGTTGQSKRIEGFEIKLTGDVPEAMELRYNVHVQNKGWLYDEDDCSNWPKDGAYAGTRGDSLRIEAVKIVLTDGDGQPLPGYSVQYRGHVQNIGDLPKDLSQWLVDGEQLGTVGSSLRLEALLVQVVKTAVEPPEPAEPLVYDSAGTYGPTTGLETIAGDVTIAADGVTLQNLTISGNLTISEAVGDGNVTLNNVTVAGDTVVRGGGKDSIHLNGGQYSRIIMEKTASGAVRIVATDVDGLDVVVAEDASGETIILEGGFASVTVNAPDMMVTTQGHTTTIGTLTVGVDGAGTTLNLAGGSTVTELVLDGKATVKGQGTVTRADVNADGVVFEKVPGSYAVKPGLVIPPVFPTPNSGGGGSGGGGGGPTTIAVSGVSLNKNSATMNSGESETLTATIAPANATNKAVSFSSSAPAVATVDPGSGLVTAVAVGTARITVTTTDGSKQASCDVTVSPIAVTGVTLTPQTLKLVYGDSATLLAAVAPVNATNKAVSFSSSDPNVVIVDPDTGLVTTVGAGMATITVVTADHNFSANCPVTVQGLLSVDFRQAVAGLTDNYVAMTLAGDTFKGGSSFVFNPGTTGLILGSPTWDSTHYTLGFSNAAAPGTLTLLATGLTSGVDSSTVSVTVLDPVTSLANMAVTDTTASFSWSDLSGANAVTLQQQKSGESTWTPASCAVTPDVDATTATVTGLSPATDYHFRLLVSGGATPGVSNSVTVKTKPVAMAVSLNKTSADLIMGSTLALTATVLPADAVNTTVSWTSDNDNYATVAENGEVTPVASGPAVITATTANGLTATCAVTVKPLFAATNDGSKATISVYNGTETNVVIPETIADLPVTAIEANAFSGKTTIQSVTIPSTVTSIGANAFKDSGLTSIALPAVTSIGEGAFFNCNKLTTVSFDSGASLTTIPKNAFLKCKSLTSITIPATVTNIGIYAFQDNDALTTITIPGSVTTISEGAFYDCGLLKTVEFPASTSALTIGKNAFFGEDTLTTINLPARLTTLEEGAFHYCWNLTALNFAADCQLTSIGRDGFSECPITSLTLPAQLQTINDYSFYNNKLSGTLIIPATVTAIGQNAFEGKLPGANLTALEIKKAASYIGKVAFKNHPLTTITMPASVTVSTEAGTMGTNDSGFVAAYTANGAQTYQFSSGWSY